MARRVFLELGAAGLIAAGLGVPARALTSHVTPEMDRLVRSGVDSIYRMEFDSATAHFERMRDLLPGHPFAEFGLTASAWARYVYGSELGDEDQFKAFEAQSRRAVELANAWIAKHPDDAEAYMALGASLGIQARLQATHRQFVRAYMSARSSMKAVRMALQLDPQLYDAWIGPGMYDYYTDVYPRLIRALAKIVLRGDRERGIRELKLTVEKGRWMTVTAKMLLVEIYLHDPFGARDPAAAMRLMDEVRARYPKSAMLHSAQLIGLYQLGRLEDFHKGSLEFVRMAANGEYRRFDLAKGYVLLGTSFWAMKKPEEALAAFKRGADEKPVSRWAVWSLVRAGNILDLMGRRAEALAVYKEAAALPDRWRFKEFLEQYLEKPFRLEGEFQIDPV
ncbi:MAG: hypothetical protein HYZ75_00060 [Elusimicrobia bacterium]|nr:hypothetical protein [Elusimicrobiota bacterium]